MILDTQPFLIPAIAQTVLYSIYLVTLGHALRWLLIEDEGWSFRSRDKVNWLILTATAVVFLFSTADIAIQISLQSTFDGDLEWGGMVKTQQLIIASMTIEFTLSLITDAVLIIRCWLVHQKSWRVVCLPLTVWSVNVICMVLWVVGYVLSEVKSPTFRLLSRPAAQVFYCCNFATNLFATCAILCRVCRVARATKNPSSVLYQVCHVVAGTGVLYTSSCLPLVVSVFFIQTHKPIFILCNAINFSISGIAFNLLLIRVGQLRSEVEIGIHGSMHDISDSFSLSKMQSPDIVIDNSTLDESVSVHKEDHSTMTQSSSKGNDTLSLIFDHTRARVSAWNRNQFYSISSSS